MSTIEKIRPQAPKEFNPRTQDHGTRGEAAGRTMKQFFSHSLDADPYFIEARVNSEQKADTFRVTEAINEAVVDPKDMTEAEKQAEIAAMITQAESDDNADWFEEVQGLRNSDDSELSHQSDDYHLNVSEAELGIQSLSAKRKKEAQEATLDPDYVEDDTEDYYETGRSVYKIPVTQEDRKRNY